MKNKANKKNKKKLQKAVTNLERVRELSQENFKLLSPIGGKNKGNYLNYGRVYNYVDLFNTLKSMLNVSILALEDRQDLTLDISNKESDVKRVLEFAKNLIPFEEGIYLDEMGKLMLSDEKLNKKTYETQD
ncbi:hypothetical protein [Aestuariibaculum sediminum]|uniref:Uncharacterized protein n=1 Tax=Aestuariibaculum sediminum TaxID=2770637 RepID=A0A8J6Q237_9FLAO|nr:hypothetical protein [Aestuariibaculum sediminum]MBD0833347.1 hypothetical protein [Aestuariibaculum sediminum]